LVQVQVKQRCVVASFCQVIWHRNRSNDTFTKASLCKE